MKVIITGSTGLIGKGVLLEALKDQRVSGILVINREPVGISDPKLKEVIHKDFLDLGPVEHELAGYDACYFCLGISSFRMSEEAYTEITYNLSVKFAEALIRQNRSMVMCFISGAGTNSSEQGRTMWARVKGKAENTLLGMDFRDAYMFRPAFVQPIGDVRSKTPVYDVLITMMKPVFPLLRKMKRFVTSTEDIGKAMINVSLNGYDKKVLESIDINKASL